MIPRSLGRLGGNLPAAVTSFVGRDRELDLARRQLRDERLLTLVGVGGVGKTRLALHLGAGMARSFPGGSWLVDLASLDAGADIATAVATAVGASAPDLSGLTEHLDHKPTLLILDNCERLLEDCGAFIVELLKNTSRLRMLVTSRIPVGVLGEHVLAVTPMSTPGAATPYLSPAAIAGYDAVRLFADRAGAVVPGFSISAGTAAKAARVCALLGGIPLAIELAAARLRTVTLSELLNGLTERHHVLHLGSRAGQPRQRSLGALNEWSHALCTQPERELWARLSVFAERFDIDAAEAVCSGRGIDRRAVLDLVAGLTEKSVLIRTDDGRDTRYAMPGAIRHYGADHLRRTDQTTHYRERHAAYFLGFAERLADRLRADGIPGVYPRVRDAYANLAAAAAFLLDRHGPTDGLLRISTLSCLVPANPSAVPAAGARLHDALALGEQPTHARAAALWATTMCHLAAGRAAEPGWAEYRLLIDRLGDPTASAYARQVRAMQAAATGAFPTAVTSLDEGFDAHARAGDQFGLRHCAQHLLAVACAAGDGQAVRRLGGRVDRDERTSGTTWQPLKSAVSGLDHLLNGMPDDAEPHLVQALAALSGSGEYWWIAMCVDGLSRCAWARQDYGRAAGLADVSRTTWHLLGVRGQYAGRGLGPPDIDTEDENGVDSDMIEAAGTRRGAPQADSVLSYVLGFTPTASVRPQGPAPLTPREREVAHLVRAGLTNQAIGAHLDISKRTVESHVENIKSKLGFRRRAQISAWVTTELPDEETGARPPTRQFAPGW